MSRTRLKESVTTSGVSFTVRALKGKDQATLTEINQSGDQADDSSINKMMADCLMSLGDKQEVEITPKVVSHLLSTDRKLILVTLRQHTLNYKKTFDFKYEWALGAGAVDKDVQDYSVNLTPENFPVTPYWWVSDKIEEEKKDDPNYVIPDGHDVSFPIMYESYEDMLSEHQEVEGEFEDGTRYKWKMMDGNIEKNMSKLKKININTPIAQRSPKYLFGNASSENEKGGSDIQQVWTILNIEDADVSDLEVLRKDIKDKEGDVDTSLTIQNAKNASKQITVDLIQIPAFFFPSMGQ